MIKLLRRLVAFVRGTFVADCPSCHRHFYGFHAHMTQVKFKGKHYRILCHRCVIDMKLEEQKLLK